MTKIPDIFYKVTTQVVFFVVLPAFFLVWLLVYQSSYMEDFFAAQRDMLSFNVTIVSLIMVATLAISRMLIFILRKHMKLNWVLYGFWCVGELLFTSLFVGMYMWLISLGEYSYFYAVGNSFAFSAMVLIYPYVILTFAYQLIALSNREEQPVGMIRFVDNTQRLKAVVAVDALMYVEAQENYVNVCYSEGDAIKVYVLRNSMKALETLLTKHGVVRCQRSYYVNPKRVKLLRREKDGVIVAELDNSSAKKIPVSQKYYENLTKMLQ